MNQRLETGQLMERALIWDNHACMPLRPLDDSFLPQLERHRKNGVNFVSLNVGYDPYDWHHSFRMLSLFRAWIFDHPETLVLATDVDAILAAQKENKLAVAFDIEGMNAVVDQPDLIRLYYDLGVRWMLIAYNNNNAAGGGCHDNDTGLSAFGRQLIDEMQQVGMVVCCSHTGARTAMDIMEYANGPVIFSHSNPRALWDHPRNISDELMKTCADTGGVVGINGIGIFMGHNDASTEAIVRHIKYAVELIGIDHVGLGIDYCFDQADLDAHNRQMSHVFPKGYGYEVGVKIVRPEQIPEIIDSLLRSGYTDTDLEKVLGGNFLRIARNVWK